MVIAEIWAKYIINGKRTYSEVPAKIKDAVKSILIEKGREDLVK